MVKYLIAGLGNIGNEYANTRHNIGFDVANVLVQKHKSSFAVGKMVYKAEFKLKGKTIICICPTTYMNLSGKAIKYWLEKENIALENLLVILDDLAISINELRLRESGSSGGHNGLKSIEFELGTQQYNRLRFGIGNNFSKGMQSDFVLGKWANDDIPIVKNKIEKATQVIEAFVLSGYQQALKIISV